MSKGKRAKKKKMKTWQKVLIIILTIILVLAGGAYWFIHSTLNKTNKVDIDKSNLDISTEYDSKGIKNIAIFGIDAPKGQNGRSDSIMIATIDKKHKKMKITSIIRDSYVEIPGRSGKDKINHAYAFGGPELAIRTINKNFNMNIEDFVAVNFSSLPKLIDSIGGVELMVTSDEMNKINPYIEEINKTNGTNAALLTKSGTQVFNGTQALAYSRIRNTAGGDFERTHRQREVLSALFSKFTTLSVTSYPSVLNDLLPLVDTNLSVNEMLGLAMDAASLSSTQMEQERFPRDDDGSGQKINGVYYYVFDINKTAKQMCEYIFNDVK